MTTISRDEELSRFRDAWLAEVRQRSAGGGPSAPHPASTDPKETLVPETLTTDSDTTIQAPARSFLSFHGPLENKIPLPPVAVAALAVYRQAIIAEQNGDLNDALILYRKAFRQEANIDRLYQQQELITSLVSTPEKPDVVAQDTEILQTASALAQASISESVHVQLLDLVLSFPEDCFFEAEDEKKSAPLGRVPEEVLVYILRKLDPTSIERFATVCRKGRLLSLDPVIWREIVVETYKPPQLPDADSCLKVMELFEPDFRLMYIKQPRVRTDGVYISVCHYIRYGLGENPWVNTSFLVTYHRRFYPNGQVLSLLANEEQHSPAQVIPLLKPTLQMKGLSIGTWTLTGTTILLSNLREASDAAGRYIFRMTLSLGARPAGRWNKLEMKAYDSIQLRSGDVVPVVTKNERPFWFSKVKSYANHLVD